MATLKVISGPAAGRTLSIDRRTVIGRFDADLTIDDDQLSRNHMAVEPFNAGVVVEDLGSTNGTFVDGRRIAGPVTLTENATLRAGNSQIEIHVSASDETRVRAPRVAEPEERTVMAPRDEAPSPSRRPPALVPMMTIRSGPLAGRTFAIDRPILIGRRGGDLSIDEAEVSSRHARLRPGEAGVVVEDLGSSNGTFVDGERITDAVTLTGDATLRIGTVEIGLAIPTSAGGRIALPDLDHAAPSAVTRARAAPAASAQPAAPAPAAPSAPAAPLPDATALPEAARSPAARPPQSGRRRRELLVSGLILIVAAAIVGVLIAVQSGKTRHTHALSNTLRTAVLSQTGLSITFVGLQTGAPTGTGAATIDQTFVPPEGKQPLGVGVPTKFTAKVISHFDQGSISSIVTGTATRQPDTSVKVVGHGTIVDGSGTYQGASGSFTQTGGRPPHSDRAVFTLTGSVRY